MQLDHAHIAIRERSFLDLLDLALRVIRVHAWGLIAAFAAGVVPMMIANELLLVHYRERDFELGFPLAHMVFMTLLVLYEIPLATAPATLYLGQVLFRERAQPGQIARDMLKSLPQLIFYQLFLRVPFLGWTYLNEVILLDRNPFRRKSPQARSTHSRSKNLHRTERGDLITRSFGSLMMSGALTVALWMSLYMIRSGLLGSFEWDRAMSTFYYPLAMWSTICYFSVVRFLSYLDLRIRREGWEVELMMRAEETRLKRQLT